jgi:hypothetical protein
MKAPRAPRIRAIGLENMADDAASGEAVAVGARVVELGGARVLDDGLSVVEDSDSVVDVEVDRAEEVRELRVMVLVVPELELAGASTPPEMENRSV